jgi:hypothetical protein
VAAVACAVVAWLVMAFVLAAMFAAGGYTREALVESSPWDICAIGGFGALVGAVVAWMAGKSPLPVWVKPVVLGSLGGVAVVVIATLFVACAVGGPSSIGQAPYLDAGLVYGVPLGLVAGAVNGLVFAKRHRAELYAAPARPHEH